MKMEREDERGRAVESSDRSGHALTDLESPARELTLALILPLQTCTQHQNPTIRDPSRFSINQITETIEDL